MKFFYVYILESLGTDGKYYVGYTEDLKERVRRHNNGEVPHTNKFRPWKFKTAVAFADKTHALDFERYLKTASGRAFAKKRL
jgi:predicted GIY-YIG superfamily endonuclease